MLALTSALPAAGCAVNTVGFVAADVIKTKGAYVWSVEVVGGQLRTSAQDGGMTLGYTRRTYVYPDSIPSPPEPGRYFGYVLLPDEPAIAMDHRTLGLEARANEIEFGVTLGLKSTTVLAQVPDDTSIAYTLAFAPDRPAETRLDYCIGSESC